MEIVGPEEVAERAVAWLAAGGREARWMRDFEYGPPAPGRLWEPNDWLAEMRAHLPPGRAIDLGAGTGRDAVFLAGHGWRVQAVDHLEDALARGRDLAARYLPPEAAARIEWEQQELEAGEFAREFDLVTMFFFLHRPLLARTPEWLRPGGNLVVETFTTLHRERHGKPRSAELALRPGELPALATGLTVRHYDEAWRGERHTARLWATVLP